MLWPAVQGGVDNGLRHQGDVEQLPACQRGGLVPCHLSGPKAETDKTWGGCRVRCFNLGRAADCGAGRPAGHPPSLPLPLTSFLLDSTDDIWLLHTNLARAGQPKARVTRQPARRSVDTHCLPGVVTKGQLVHRAGWLSWRLKLTVSGLGSM